VRTCRSPDVHTRRCATDGAPAANSYIAAIIGSNYYDVVMDLSGVRGVVAIGLVYRASSDPVVVTVRSLHTCVFFQFQFSFSLLRRVKSYRCSSVIVDVTD